MDRMDRLNYILSILILSSLASCCPVERPQPARPNKVLGWNDSYEGGVHSIGILVLNKGESSDNGKIGVTVLDVIPPDQCAHPNTYHGSPKAVLRFFRPSDGLVFCEFTAVGDNTNSILDCNPSAGISVIGMNAINTKEQWVYFDLRE